MASKVPRKPLGQTGLEVSVLGFGASPLGSVYEPVSEEQCVATVHEAFQHGINFIDTSAFYGNGLSEIMVNEVLEGHESAVFQMVGKALKGLPRDQVVVATKMGRYGADLFDFSAERVRAGVRESLERLQLSYVDILHAHDIEFRNIDQVVNETIPALVKLREEGLIRHVGFTGLPLAIYKKVLDRVPPGSVDCVLSYCHNTLVDNSLQELLPYLQHKGVGVINASPMAMGLLTKKGPAEWHPAPEHLRKTCAKAVELAEKRGVALPRLALKHALASEVPATTLVGMTSPEEVRSNVQAALEATGVAQSPDAELERSVLSEVEKVLEPVMNTTWPSGRPENNSCPSASK